MRSSTDRWLTLSIMLAQVERCLEANARLDVAMDGLRDPRGRRGMDHAAESGRAISARIDAAAEKISREVDKLTAERLNADLARKQRRIAS